MASLGLPLGSAKAIRLIKAAGLVELGFGIGLEYTRTTKNQVPVTTVIELETLVQRHHLRIFWAKSENFATEARAAYTSEGLEIIDCLDVIEIESRRNRGIGCPSIATAPTETTDADSC